MVLKYYNVRPTRAENDSYRPRYKGRQGAPPSHAVLAYASGEKLTGFELFTQAYGEFEFASAFTATTLSFSRYAMTLYGVVTHE